MARAMNVEKRAEALKAICARAKSHSAKSRRIASELTSSSKFMKGPRARQATRLADRALKLADALDRVIEAAG